MNNVNLYIDESCHLENDGLPVMLMALTKVPEAHKKPLTHKFKGILLAHKSPTELKWNTLSKSRLPLYKALIDAFFEEPALSFRCLMIKNKQNLDHAAFNQGGHDLFYYKMVYQLLNNEHVIPSKEHQYRVFLDIKDTRGRERLAHLKAVFDNKYDNQSPFIAFQHLHSHDTFWIQFTDFLMGAISFVARGLDQQSSSSLTKKEVAEYLRHKSGYLLSESTVPWESKFNLFDFQIQSRMTSD